MKICFVFASLLRAEQPALAVRLALGQGYWTSLSKGRKRRNGKEKEGNGESCFGADPRPRERNSMEKKSQMLSVLIFRISSWDSSSYSAAYGTGATGGVKEDASDFMKSILITLCNPQHSVITRLLCSSTKKTHQESNIKLASGNMKIHETHN